MNRNLTIWTSVACALFGLPGGALCRAGEVFPVVHSEPIAVRVLNGKNGHPLARTRVVLTAGYNRRDLELAEWREEVQTDSAGVARLSNALRNLPLLQVEVLNRHECAPGAKSAVMSLERIREGGLTGANRCGWVVVENAPGMLTVFVKGKKGDSRAGSIAPAIAALPDNVSKAPSMAAVSAPVPKAVAEAKSATSTGPVPDSDSGNTSGSKARPAASDAQERESLRPTPHGRATVFGDENDDGPRLNPTVESAVGSSDHAAKAIETLPDDTARSSKRISGHAAAPSAAPRHVSANRSASGIRPVTETSAAQAHGSAFAAVQAAGGEVSGTTSQTQAAPPHLYDPKPVLFPE